LAKPFTRSDLARSIRTSLQDESPALSGAAFN
jgi:hypothetical protein